MAYLGKILRSGVIQCYTNIRGKMFSKMMSSVGVCGGSDGKKGGTGDNDDKICPVCNSTDCKACAPPIYDCRKYGHELPKDTRQLNFDNIPKVPSDIFRATDGEALGPGGNACKCGCYANPEYFSFHHMSYYDMHLILRANRIPSPQFKRKP